ncbi:hypothetical protein FOXYSP1_08598 [Fusarium oxysporum f. sp. phaseoli]
MGERTGPRILYELWSYVVGGRSNVRYKGGTRQMGGVYSGE